MTDRYAIRLFDRLPVLLGELIARLGVASIRTLDVHLGCGTGLLGARRRPVRQATRRRRLLGRHARAGTTAGIPN